MRFDEPFDFVPPSPSMARVHSCLLGGKDVYRADRDAALQLTRAAPTMPEAVRAGRKFLLQAARSAARQGIHQVLDIGVGMPVHPSLAEVAADIRDDVVVTGVDTDLVALAHHRALSTGVFVEGDLRYPDQILNNPTLTSRLELADPVLVVLGSVLHFLGTEDDPQKVLSVFRDRLAPGSVLAFTHLCVSDADPAMSARLQSAFEDLGIPAVLRTIKQIEDLLDGYDVMHPGVVPVQDGPVLVGRGGPMVYVGGIGRVPSPARPDGRLQ